MSDTSSPSRFVGGKPRHAVVALDCPIEFSGTIYSAIGLRRLTAGEVATYVEMIRALVKDNPHASVRPPIFISETGDALPEGLFDALDDDDALKLDEAAESFLPRRFRGEKAEQPSAQTDGAATEPTS